MLVHGSTGWTHTGLSVRFFANVRAEETVRILPLSGMMDPPLTTLSVSKHDMGRRAFDLLAARIAEGRDRPAEKVLIDAVLIVRGSVRRK